jgi:glutamine amidotransferase
MSKCKIAVVDYGAGNLLSVQRAVEYCGGNAFISSEPNTIIQADKLILPGVGAFKNAMDSLKSTKIAELIKKEVHEGKQLLGICLGMQLLVDESEEFGRNKGLGIIAGKVTKISNRSINGEKLLVPHIGWNSVYCKEKKHDKKINSSNRDFEDMYFTHSYAVITSNVSDTIATTNYGGIEIAAIIQKDNVVGCQFHPEKSGSAGLNFIKSFCDN